MWLTFNINSACGHYQSCSEFLFWYSRGCQTRNFTYTSSVSTILFNLLSFQFILSYGKCFNWSRRKILHPSIFTDFSSWSLLLLFIFNTLEFLKFFWCNGIPPIRNKKGIKYSKKRYINARQLFSALSF